MKTEKKAVVRLSGGLDSATVGAIARRQGYRLYCLSFNYGQRHYCELEAAEKVAQFLAAERHLTLHLDLNLIGGSSLTDQNLKVPQYRMSTAKANIPITYVPARNTIFIAHAVAWAETLEARDIFLGVNAIDYSGYPDCRPEFIQAMERAMNLGTKRGVEEDTPYFRLHTPLIELHKHEIIQLGMELKVDYGLTHSCYDPDEQGTPCGRCDSCCLRLQGFAAAGIRDPLIYQI